LTFELQRKLIILRGNRRIFGSVAVGQRELSGFLNLPRRLADERIQRIEPLTKRLYLHRYRVTDPSALDEEFGRWLCEARNVGDGVAERIGD
jgi:hypothetical protein